MIRIMIVLIHPCPPAPKCPCPPNHPNLRGHDENVSGATLVLITINNGDLPELPRIKGVNQSIMKPWDLIPKVFFLEFRWEDEIQPSKLWVSYF